MARKLQIKRGAKANLPTLSQGEFGFCTDAGAEELHLGNGTKNLQIPMVNVYYDDMDNLVSSGIYRVGTNINLPEGLWYSQVLVMQGADSDTVAQVGVSYTTGNIFARSGQKSGGVWTFTDWVTPYSNANPPDTDAMGVVSKAGDTMTGQLSIQNRDDYLGVTKVREIDNVPYIVGLGVGSDTTKGASGSMRLVDNTGATLGRIDAWANGELTYQGNGASYFPIGRLIVGSYTGTTTSTSANKQITLDLPPKLILIVCTTSGTDCGSCILDVQNKKVITWTNSANYQGPFSDMSSQMKLTTNATGLRVTVTWTSGSYYKYINANGKVYRFYAIC